MQSLLVASLSKIRKASSRSHRELRESCDSTLKTLKETSSSDVADVYFKPFALALATRETKLVVPALICIHDMITFGYLRGEGPAPSDDHEKLIDFVVQTIADCATIAIENIQLQTSRTLLATVASSTCAVHEASLRRIVAGLYHIYLYGHSAMIESTAKSVLTQILHIVFHKMESYDLRAVSLPELKTTEDNIYPSVMDILGFQLLPPSIDPLATTADGPISCSIYHQDALGLLQRLCLAAEKPLSEEGQLNSVALSKKSLSLELILSILKNAGPTFRHSEQFIKVIRTSLCVSLVESSTCNSKPIVHVSLEIFLELIAKFKRNLKREIEVFISDIFLRILESPNSSDDHKQVVMQTFKHISKDAEILGNLFVNYDCDWNSSDIFSRIVDDLAKVSKTNVAEGLECLVSIVSTLKHSIEAPAEDVSDETMMVDDSDTHSVSSEPLSVVDNFDKKQRNKQEIATGILKFNTKPNAGIQYLVDNGHLQHTPRDVAEFLLKNADALNKTVVGDYLGKEQAYRDGFCIQVLHQYVDQMNFKTMAFDQAIRHFLSGFRLPGEAQKIDRMMEKFAERYCLDNPDVFPSADTAFVLGFSVIMLQTDLHNPSIREDRKMTKEGFIRNNRGISAGSDLPEEFLAAIYDRIQHNPFTLKEDDVFRKAKQPEVSSIFSTAGSADRIRQEAFNKERQLMSQSLQTRSEPKFKDYVELTCMETQHIKPMFELIWGQVLACCSLALESALQVDSTVLSSFQGIQDGISLSGRFHMTQQRDAFVNGLSKFTGLRMGELQEKHIEGIRTLLSVAVQEGAYLDDAWEEILQCISRLQHLINIGEGMPPPMGFESTNPIEQMNANRILQSIDPSAIDHVFLTSKHLNDTALHRFVQQLCIVSLWELSGNNASVFSLQKLVEIADMNMDIRSRLVWTSVWEILARHFTTVGCLENDYIAMHAIDSLRQLSTKFLEKQELKAFNFQRLFLKPFEIIISNSPSNKVKELVLQCVQHIILARGNRIRSGWKTLIQVFTSAAADETDSVMSNAFSIVQRIVQDHLTSITEEDGLEDIITCLFCFAEEATVVQIRVFAIQTLKLCLFNQLEASHEVILPGLALRMIDSQHIVRQAAIEAFFDVVELNPTALHGFQNIILETLTQMRELETLQLTLVRFIPVATIEYFNDLKLFLFDCIQNSNPAIACVGVESLGRFLVEIGDQLDAKRWTELLNYIEDLLHDTRPEYLVKEKSISLDAFVHGTAITSPIFSKTMYPNVVSVLGFQYKKQIRQLSVVLPIQLELLRLIGQVLRAHFHTLSTVQSTRLIRLLQQSYEFAATCDLLDLEVTGKREYILVLFQQNQMKALQGLIISTIDAFDKQKGFVPLIVAILNGLQHLSIENTRENLHWIYPTVIQLIRAPDPVIREKLFYYFDTKLATLILK